MVWDKMWAGEAKGVLLMCSTMGRYFRLCGACTGSVSGLAATNHFVMLFSLEGTRDSQGRGRNHGVDPSVIIGEGWSKLCTTSDLRGVLEAVEAVDAFTLLALMQLLRCIW